MDGLINRASALFRDLALSPNDRYPHTLHCIRIHLYEDGHKDVPPDLHRITCLVGANADGCLDRTVDWASIPPPVRPGTRLAGVLRMVILARDDAHAVGVHPGTFSRLFDLFGIDPYMKYLVARSVDGYYTALPRLSAPPCGMLGPDADAARNSRSFYVGVRDSHAMLWSCFPAGGPDGAAVMSAVAVCGAAQVAPLAAEARTFASVVGHPAMPVLACCSRVVQDVDGFVADTLCTLQAVEAATGLSPHAAARCRPELAAAAGPEGAPAPPPSRRAASAESTARLGEMSGWMGEASVKLAQFSHHLGLVRGVVQQIHEPTFEHICNGTVKDVAQLLMETSSMTLDYVQYLAKRVEVQHVVLANLIARNEAEMAFQLALDSERIAESTANDGFAMMTIAIMTMFFLPATFFATIFAMPILGWDKEGVMMPQMRLYLALALPVTAGILAFWGVLTCCHRREAKRKARKRQGWINILHRLGTSDNGRSGSEEHAREPANSTSTSVESKLLRSVFRRPRRVQEGTQHV